MQTQVQTPSGPPGKAELWSLITLSTFFTAWAGWFIYKTSFVVQGERHFCLFDDAMISMSYARNLMEGFGLQWGRYGEPVEGFTTPLWTLGMVPWNAFDLPLRWRPLGVQLTSLVLLLANLWCFARLARKHFCAAEFRTFLPATFLLVTFYPLSYWGLMGMETALQALLVSLTVLLVLDFRQEPEHVAGSGMTLVLFALFGLAYLVRMDMLILVLGTFTYLAVSDGVKGLKRYLSARGILVFGLLVGGYQLFRLWYFGDLLPNTYYLKLTGIPLDVRLGRGLLMFFDFLVANHALLLVVIAILFLRRWGASPRWRLPVLLVLLYFGYSIWVGGDAWEMHNNVRANRFVAFVLPLLFLPWNEAMSHFVARGSTRAGRITAAAALTLLFALSLNGLVLSPQSEANREKLLITERPLLVTSHAVVLQNLRRFQRLVEPGALVVTYWAGIPAYFSDYRLFDALGYNNEHTARLPAKVEAGADPRSYTPGHAKWDPQYILETVRPDAFFQAWHIAPKTLQQHGYQARGEFWIRPESEYVQPGESAVP